MQRFRVVTAVLTALACVLVAAVVVATPENARGALDVPALTNGLLAVALGQKLQMPTDIKSMSFEMLKGRAKPGGSAGMPEANVDVLYDTKTYVAAGQAQLKFFVDVNADATLTNLESAGQLPADTYFDVWRIFIDANRVPTATVADTAAGVINDIATILHAARGTLTFTMWKKPLGPIPLTFFGSSGTVEGIIGSGRAAAAGAVIQVGRMPDNGGWPANGTIRIPPQTKFGVNLDFVSTAVAVDTPLSVRFLGVAYRPAA